MLKSKWFRNDTLLNRLRPASGTTQQAASSAKLQPDERRPGTSGSTPDILFAEIESQIAEQFCFREILEEACLVTGATGAAIALVRGKEMVCRANAGADAPDLGVCLDRHRGLSGTCIQTRQLQHCADSETDLRVDRQVCRWLGVRSLAVLPLLRGNELVGVFEVLSSRPNAFGEKALDGLQQMATRILAVTRHADVAIGMPPESSAKDKEVARSIKSNIAKTSLRQRGPRNNATLTTLLGVLVIAMAVLLGMVVGWRFGWQRAARQIGNRSSVYRDQAFNPKLDGPVRSLPSAETPCRSTVYDMP